MKIHVRIFRICNDVRLDYEQLPRAKQKYIAIVTVQPTVYATDAIVMSAVGCTVGSAHDTDDREHRATWVRRDDDRDDALVHRNELNVRH